MLCTVYAYMYIAHSALWKNNSMLSLQKFNPAWNDTSKVLGTLPAEAEYHSEEGVVLLIHCHYRIQHVIKQRQTNVLIHDIG